MLNYSVAEIRIKTKLLLKYEKEKEKAKNLSQIEK